MFNWKSLIRSKTFNYGMPMLLLIVGGSFGLREFAQIRYDEQKLKSKVNPDMQALLDFKKKPTTLEEEYEKMKQKNLDGWKNIRAPRPWENSREYQEELRRNKTD